MDAKRNLELTPPAADKFHAERLELARVLKEVLSRSSNMERLLRYVCERYFDGQATEIKEYSIATEAFGRPADFDPVVDSIVRVEAHRLRNKLSNYYHGKGNNHLIQIQLPPGGYVPQFIRNQSSLAEPADSALAIEVVAARPEGSPAVDSLPPSGLVRPSRRITARTWIYVAMVTLAVVGLGTALSLRSSIQSLATSTAPGQHAPQPTGSRQESVLRILAGGRTNLSFDVSDNVKEIWASDRYFQGGSAEEIPPRIFSYTTQSSLYYSRRRGDFSYDIPLASGRYELRLYFADAFFGADNFSGGGEGSRLFDVKANGKFLLKNFDVIADIGGSNSADIKIFDNIQPGPDGFLHLGFSSRRDAAFVNAIEIVPTPSDRMLPIRLSAWVTQFSDEKGGTWNSDRYFRGGVHFPWDSAQLTASDPGNFTHGRFGNFTYQVPVPDKGLFTLRLRFCRPTARNFLDVSQGDDNFNIYLNGKSLLENFSITSVAAYPSCTVKEFENIAPTPQGKMQLSFVPNRGYAFINTIEVVQESGSSQ